MLITKKIIESYNDSWEKCYDSRILYASKFSYHLLKECEKSEIFLKKYFSISHCLLRNTKWSNTL